MKINFRSMIVAAAAVVLTMASCSKTDEGADGKNEARQVRIQVANEGVESRATGTHIAAGAVNFTGGYLFFTTNSGTITKKFTINTGNAAESGGVVGIGALKQTNGTVIQNIPGTSTKVYFVGNLNSALPAVTEGTTNISVITKIAVAVQDIFDATGKGVDKVTLYGTGNVVAAATDYEAKFQVSPIGARMEIGKITAGGTITSYKVEGIFINNYYVSMNLDGTLVASSLKDNGQTAANYVDAAGSYTTGNGIVHDYAAAGIGSIAALVCTPNAVPNANDVWGYNLLALASGSAAPQIAIRISGVVLNGTDNTTYAGTHFLSISNMYDQGTTTPIVFSQRNVYRIPNVSFSENDLTPKPFEKTKKVAVEVEMLDWISNDIDYDFN